jgi:hypothetical protein
MNEPAPQSTRRRVGLGVMALFGVILLWAVGQSLLGGTAYEREMTQASRSLFSKDWQGAKRHFREAAASKILDKDAIYGVHLVERLDLGTALTTFELAILEGNLLAARAACDAEKNPELRGVQRSFLDQLTENAE